MINFKDRHKHDISTKCLFYKSDDTIEHQKVTREEIKALNLESLDIAEKTQDDVH